jgi:aspartyl/asparaginyl-tRNA synthetase
MNVVNLVKDAEKYLGTEVTVTGVLNRPRKRHSSYLFFNIEDNNQGIQVVVKQDLLGKELFKEVTFGLCHKDTVTVTGRFDQRSSNREDFYKYEITARDIKKN